MKAKKTKLRKNIIEKFKTIKYFCKLSGIGYSGFKMFLNTNSVNEKLYQEALFKLNSIEVDHIEGEIKDEDRKAIRRAILNNFDSYTHFCDIHNDFNMVYISNVVKGKLLNETPKYIRLTTILKRDFGLEI